MTRNIFSKPKALFVGLLFIVLLAAAVVISAPNTPVMASESSAADYYGEGVDHSEFEPLQAEFASGPEVTAACLTCHSNVGEDVLMTTHWTWEYTTEDGQDLGKNNVINNYCIAVPSNEARCTSCHIGYGFRDEDTFDFADPTLIDCLVCHDTTGAYKKFPAGAGHPAYEETVFAGNGKTYGPTDLAAIAQAVGTPSRSNCGSCHFSGGGGPGVKHGDLDPSLVAPTTELDVHMGGQDMLCQDCHTSEDHDIAGSRYEMTVGEPTDGLKTCDTCHTAAPHAEEALNTHTDRIACQTCHIPEYARGFQTKTWWDWTVAGDKNEDGKPFQIKDDNGWVTYDSKKGEFVWEMNVVPTYMWFNGDSTWITLDDKVNTDGVTPINVLHGDINDETAQIFPMKEFGGIQPIDGGTDQLAVPHLFPNAGDAETPTAYWKAWDWDKALATGQAAVGYEYSGELGYAETVMYWPLAHTIAPAADAVACESCHTAEAGRLDFAALGYSEDDVARLTSFPPVTRMELEAAAAEAAAAKEAAAEETAAAEAAEEAVADEAVVEEEAAASDFQTGWYVGGVVVVIALIAFFVLRKKD